jgi:RNA polymerase sigma-70 factor (ECF subfamily)
MSGDSERTLERAAVGGDEEALRALLLRHGPEVERGLEIHAKWRSVIDTADIMQVTYLEAFLGIHRFDADRGEPFVHWLRCIAENNLRDAVRGLSAQKQPPPDRRVTEPESAASVAALYELLGATTTTPSRAAAAAESANRINEALDALPSGYRMAVQMYDLEGRSIDEVAAALNKSTGAVHMMRARAHDRLREILSGPGGLTYSQL